jgi:hypothetical protein
LNPLSGIIADDMSRYVTVPNIIMIAKEKVSMELSLHNKFRIIFGSPYLFKKGSQKPIEKETKWQKWLLK